MISKVFTDRARFFLNRFRERLWVKPLVVCLLSIVAVFVAKLADDSAFAEIAPKISSDSLEELLSIMASSMLVIATFSVGSMVSAYASAANTATPRSFNLVVADDASQNALSTFVGTFIFSIVAFIAVKNDYFQAAGLFILFILTVFLFGMVVFTFVRWVDRIARLGRMATTIEKVEKATAGALKRRRNAPHLCGVAQGFQARGQAVVATKVGYVQYININALQKWAEKAGARVVVTALPGTFATPNRPLAYVSTDSAEQAKIDCTAVAAAFQIGDARLFDDDPRFGLVVLSEIAGRALSPGVNDPGTAICVIGTLVRLFALWVEPVADDKQSERCDRVEVPEVSVRDMFDDAFTAIARDGAGTVEVSVRLQKAFGTLASFNDSHMRDAALHHGQLALKRARVAMHISEDLKTVEDAACFAAEPDELAHSANTQSRS